MKTRQLRQYRMLVRVQKFGAAHADRFRDDTVADQAFASISEAVSQLETYAVERLTTQRRSAKERAVARAALEDILERISQTALVLARRDKQFVNTFLMPVRESAEAVLTTARAFARDVEPLAARFRERGFSTSFPEDFSQLVQRYEEAFKKREGAKALTAAANARIEAAFDTGMNATRELDVIVANTFGDDPVVTAEWLRSRRIGYGGGKEPPGLVEPIEKGPIVSPAATPAAAPSAAEDVATDDEVAASQEAAPTEVASSGASPTTGAEAEDEAAA